MKQTGKPIISLLLTRYRLPGFRIILILQTRWLFLHYQKGLAFRQRKAACWGKKVVITDTGSLPEVAFGRVVKVQKADSHALAQGVIRMFNNDFEVVAQKTFTWEKALQQYDTVLQELFN